MLQHFFNGLLAMMEGDATPEMEKEKAEILGAKAETLTC
jgi:hypothetical protein